MHEYSLMENVVSDILSQLKTKPLGSHEAIKKVVLKVGALDIHSQEAFVQAFEMTTQKTALEGVQLILEIDPGIIKCVCGYEGVSVIGHTHDPTPIAPCPRCGKINHVLGGRGVSTIELVIE